MLDINKIREHTKEVKTALLKRLDKKDFNLEEIIELDDERRKFLTEMEGWQAERNEASKSKPSPEVIAKMKEVGEQIKTNEEKVKVFRKYFFLLHGSLFIIIILF
jgi:seryl-tRNA synthetase